MILASRLNVAPDSIFSVRCTAYMIFIVVVGGIGTLEGLWGPVSRRFGLRLTNVGYTVRGLEERD